MAKWTAADIPDLIGRAAIVTGANSGLGFEESLALARRGADVTMACRDQTKGASAVERVRSHVPGAIVALASLDLADLSSVRAFAAEYRATHERLDILINNAGIMGIPRRTTADGFEMQFGTNHLGHFALTGALLPLLAAQPDARVATVSSSLHRIGRINFDDLQGERQYNPWAAYGQSKLANLLFAFELQRRADTAGMRLLSVVAHPGYAATNLQTVSSAMSGGRARVAVTNAVNRFAGQSGAMGALPALYAATAPGVIGGTYFGPDGIGEMRGYPKTVLAKTAAYDVEAARRLWDVSEALTGMRYDFVATASTATSAVVA